MPRRRLFITARHRDDLLDYARTELAAETHISVLADRRTGERRRVSRPTPSERRRGERRQQHDVARHLGELGYAVAFID